MTRPRKQSSRAGSKNNLGPLPPPKRPLNAYNFFFKDQREQLLGEASSPSDDILYGYTVKRKRAHVRVHGKLPFMDLLVKTIAKK
jgi:hypothetical protein